MKQQSIIKNASDMLHERTLQVKLHALFVDGTQRMNGISGNVIHMLNPGRLNPYPGPDFLDMAMLINGELHVGKGEFHKQASDWYAHKHHVDQRYDDVLIHVICVQDIDHSIGKETIIVPYEDIISVPENRYDLTLHSLEDVQDYAYRRLMRRCNEVHELSRTISDPMKTLSAMCMIFLRKRANQRRRYQQSNDDMQGIIQMFMHSSLITAILQGADIPIDILRVNAQSRNGISTHLFLEVFVNACYPFLLMQSQAKREQYITWYWSQRSLLQYQSLKRRFPDIPQNYMWQQQGILEYLRNEYSGGNICGEHLPTYLDLLVLEQ